MATVDTRVRLGYLRKRRRTLQSRLSQALEARLLRAHATSEGGAAVCANPRRTRAMHRPKFSATGGGDAFPNCRYAAALPPTNFQLGGKPCSTGGISTVR